MSRPTQAEMASAIHERDELAVAIDRIDQSRAALRSQLAEREAELENEREYTAQYKAGAQVLLAEVERLREAGDALAAAADYADRSGREPVLDAFYRALAAWHTATGGDE